MGRDLGYQLKSICRAESILSALPKSLGKRNVIEAFDQAYPQSTLRTELAKHTNLARWAILARFDLLFQPDLTFSECTVPRSDFWER